MQVEPAQQHIPISWRQLLDPAKAAKFRWVACHTQEQAVMSARPETNRRVHIARFGTHRLEPERGIRTCRRHIRFSAHVQDGALEASPVWGWIIGDTRAPPLIAAIAL